MGKPGEVLTGQGKFLVKKNYQQFAYSAVFGAFLQPLFATFLRPFFGTRFDTVLGLVPALWGAGGGSLSYTPEESLSNAPASPPARLSEPPALCPEREAAEAAMRIGVWASLPPSGGHPVGVSGVDVFSASPFN